MRAMQQIDSVNLTAHDILQNIKRIGDNWAAGHPLSDDVTLVVMKAT